MPSLRRIQPIFFASFLLLLSVPSLSFAQTVTVPDVRNKSFNVADTTLKGAGLLAEIEGYAPTNSRESAGKVTTQTPPPNAQVARGSKVQLRILFLSGSQVVVPSVVQRPLSRAQQIIDQAGLQRRVVGFANTLNPAMVNTVASQNPPANSRIERGKVIDLTLFRTPAPPPPPSVQVPNVGGRSLQEAHGILRQAGLRGQVVGHRVTPDPAQRDRVAAQVPAPGAQIPRGRAVNLTLYAAPTPIPNVLNQPLPQAQQVLSQAGLRAQVVGHRDTRDANLRDRVATQVPAPGAQVARGSAVNLTLYRLATAPPPPPPGAVGVPAVRNLPVPQAEQILAQAGLKGRVVGHQDTPNPALKDLVAGQVPGPGAHVARGSAVDLTLYRLAAAPPPGQVSVPNVLNDPLPVAVAKLQRAGLGGGVGYRDTQDPALRDRVAHQAPAAGVQVARGSVVNLTLYRVAAAPPPPPPGAVSVPNVGGRPLQEAQGVLTQAGLQGRVVGHRDTPDANLRDRVAAQAPVAGPQVARGSAVDLTLYRVAAAPPPPPPGAVSVPNVRNLPLPQAEQILAQAGLKGRVVAYHDTPNPALKDLVAGQTPERGLHMARGSTVELRLYRLAGAPPPGQVFVPNVLNQPYAQAGTMVTGARLNIRKVGDRETKDLSMQFHVAAQVPAPGTPVSVGTTVEVTLYEVRLASISALYRGKDRDVVGTGSQGTPDGKMDGHFNLTLDTGGVRRVVTSIRLERADAQGNPIPFSGGEPGWDTERGSGRRILAVYRAGRRLNPADERVSDPTQGKVIYEVYAYHPTAFIPSPGSVRDYRLTVEFGDGGRGSTHVHWKW